MRLKIPTPRRGDEVTFEAAAGETVRRRVADAGLADGPVVLHPLRKPPLTVEQDLEDERTHVAYTVGARTCTMVAVWGEVAGSNRRLLSVTHDAGPEEAYARLSEIGALFSSRKATVRKIIYSRGELGERFGVLDEGEAVSRLGSDNVAEGLQVEYVPSKERPVSAGLIVEARTGKAAPY